MRENYVYRDCKIRMSQKVMANLLYAAIMTKAGLPTSYGCGIYEYRRDQNSYNCVDIKVHIHPDQISKFEELSGVKLKTPITPVVNLNR